MNTTLPTHLLTLEEVERLARETDNELALAACRLADELPSEAENEAELEKAYQEGRTAATSEISLLAGELLQFLKEYPDEAEEFFGRRSVEDTIRKLEAIG